MIAMWMGAGQPEEDPLLGLGGQGRFPQEVVLTVA